MFTHSPRVFPRAVHFCWFSKYLRQSLSAAAAAVAPASVSRPSCLLFAPCLHAPPASQSKVAVSGTDFCSLQCQHRRICNPIAFRHRPIVVFCSLERAYEWTNRKDSNLNICLGVQLSNSGFRRLFCFPVKGERVTETLEKEKTSCFSSFETLLCGPPTKVAFPVYPTIHSMLVMQQSATKEDLARISGRE